MSASSNNAAERKRVSVVTISPVSSGNTDALIVRIRKMSSEVPEEDIPKVTHTFNPISEVPSSQNMHSGHSKYTMTDNQKTASNSSQTTQKNQGDSSQKTDSMDSSPCLKHAAQNISRKASEIPSEKIKLCKDCSKSMLSYIFLVQDFLDSLAHEIRGDKTSGCLQCIRQEVRNSIASLPDDTILDSKPTSEDSVHQTNSKYNLSRTEDKNSSDRTRPKRTSRSKAHRQESKKHDDFHKGMLNSSHGYVSQQSQKVDFIYNVSSTNTCPEQNDKTLPSVMNEAQILLDQQSSNNESLKQQQLSHQPKDKRMDISTPEMESKLKSSADITSNIEQTAEVVRPMHPSEQLQSHEQANEPATKTVFRSPMERVQPDYNTPAPVIQEHQDRSDDFPVQRSPSLYSEGVDGIVSTLSNAEREIYDSARNGAGWESLTEPSSSVIQSEAFVTSCRNNAEAIGCLVVGTSLLLSRTSRKLCVLVSDGVSTAFRDALSAVFHTVQYARSLDSLGTTKLALLEQPELGITFDKLNIWRLTQYTKCVYLNPDTLVIQNCDELFCHEELSAVPDIGWPDCFNSGVFVFAPSIHTFWQLLEFAEKQGSYDGGDQGLLNSYFNSWSSDINKKLSFIYNLMANVSYTYTPAFQQFGRNVKIVQFHGSFKPWHVKFFTNSGMVSPASPVHPTYIQFVHIWLKIFRISVLRLMSREIQSYAASQEVICAVEILRFFPLPSESEAEFFLTPPSVRLRLAEKKLNRSTSLPISEVRRRKSAEFPRYATTEEEEIVSAAASLTEQEETKDSDDVSKPESKTGDDEQTKDNLEGSVSDEVFTEKGVAEKQEVVDKNTLPGAEVGNYLGMKAWEQGRMDYQGADSSDNVIKRLQFLMSKPN